jgi:LysM repeat protein
MARSDTRKATSTRKKRNVAETLKDLMKKPEYKTTRERKGPRGNTITDYTVDGKPMTRRRVEGVGMVSNPRKMADKPLGPPKKPTGLDAVTKKQSPTDVMKASGRGKEGVAFPKTNPKAGKTRTIKAGDTLSQIAKDNNTTINALMKLNPQITNADSLYKGQKIKTTKGTEANPYKGYTFPKAKNPPSDKKDRFSSGMVKKKKDSFSSGMVKKKSMSTRKAKPLAEGSSVGSKSKSSKPKSSKPKGVGCATSGYGKALGGR